MRVKYCGLFSYYDKRFKDKITILKICDNLMRAKQSGKNINYIQCPYCGKELIQQEI